MDKISNIIPSSSRVAAVDLKGGPAVRPGAPRFGRPEGVSTLAQQNLLTTAQKANQLNDNLMSIRNKEDRQGDIVKNIADDFFARKNNPVDESNPKVEVLENSINLEAQRPVLTAGPTATPEVDDLDLPETGRYINVHV